MKSSKSLFMKLKISTTTVLNEFSLYRETSHRSWDGFVLFFFRFKTRDGFRIFFCPLLTPLKTVSLDTRGASANV